MPGYDRSRIVGVSEQDLEEFICGICLEVFIKPTVTQCCGQTFCFDCINEWLQQNNTCPNDRKCLTRNQLQSPAKMVTNLLSNMKIKCDFHEKGCNVVIKISDLDKHKQTECDFNPLRKCNNCGQNKLNHSDKDCIKNLIKKLYTLQEEHDQLIEKLNILQKDYDQFRQKKEKEQTETESYLSEVLLEHERLKEEYDQFREKQETEKSEALIKYGILQNKFDMTECFYDSIKKTNNELQDKLSKLGKKNKKFVSTVSDFTGKFTLTTSENSFEFLIELGVSFVFNNLVKSSTPTVEIIKKGKTYTLMTISAIENSEKKFKLGKEFIETLMGVKNIRSVIIAEDNKLVQTSRYSLKKFKVVREFNGNELKVTSSVGNVVSVEVYNKL